MVSFREVMLVYSCAGYWDSRTDGRWCFGFTEVLASSDGTGALNQSVGAKARGCVFVDHLLFGVIEPSPLDV